SPSPQPAHRSASSSSSGFARSASQLARPGPVPGGREWGHVTSLRGQLLVAGPALVDPNFRRTVVLIGERGEEGAMGVVLTRASETLVEDAVPPMATLTAP